MQRRRFSPDDRRDVLARSILASLGRDVGGWREHPARRLLTCEEWTFHRRPLRRTAAPRLFRRTIRLGTTRSSFLVLAVDHSMHGPVLGTDGSSSASESFPGATTATPARNATGAASPPTRQATETISRPLARGLILGSGSSTSFLPMRFLKAGAAACGVRLLELTSPRGRSSLARGRSGLSFRRAGTGQKLVPAVRGSGSVTLKARRAESSRAARLSGRPKSPYLSGRLMSVFLPTRLVGPGRAFPEFSVLGSQFSVQRTQNREPRTGNPRGFAPPNSDHFPGAFVL